MSERQVVIGVNLQGAGGALDQLIKIREQRDALLKAQNIRLNVNTAGMEQAQRAAMQAQRASNDALRDMALLGGAIGTKAIGPTAQLSVGLAAALAMVSKLGPSMASSLQRANTEFARQRTLAEFWGKAGYLNSGVEAFKANLASFLAGSGGGFSKWLQNTSASLSAYKTGLVASAAAMVGVASAAAMSSKSAQNYIKSVFESRTMYRKLGEGPELDSAKAWVEQGQDTAWSAGRESRMSTFSSLLRKNPHFGAEEAKGATENLEKYFFHHRELLQKSGIGSTEALVSALSAQTLSGEHAETFRDLLGLGFETLAPRARFARLGKETQGLNMEQEVEERPETVLAFKLGKATQSFGDVTMGPLNTVLNLFLQITESASKIPHLPQIAGWAVVLTGAAASGAVLLSVLAPLAPVLGAVIGLLSKASLVTKGLAVAQWALNIALSANPIGLAIIAVAALVAGLYILEKRFGIVTKAWNALKSGMSSLGGAFKDAGGMGVLKVGVEALVANNPMLKILLFQFDLLKKIWLGGETLNKIMGGAMTIWQSMGQFFSWMGDLVSSILDVMAGLKEKIEGFLGGEKKKAAGSLDESKIAADVEWAKSQRFDDGKRKFDVSDETLRAARVEAETGIAQPHAPMFKESDYTRIVDAFRGRIKSDYMGSEEYANSPLPEAIKAADKRINEISLEGQAKADEAIANRDFLGFMANQYSMGARAIGAAAEGTLNWLTGAPSMDSGGTITGSGGIIGHAGEEIDNASVVADGQTVLSKINESFSTGSSGEGAGINVNAPITVNIGTVSKDVDIDRLIDRIGNEGADRLVFALRSRLDSASMRGIGYLRG